MLQQVNISRAVLQQLSALAGKAPDVEICGLLGGVFNWRMTVAKLQIAYPVENVAPNPRNRFVLNPQQQIQAMMSIFQSGQELAGIFHSHPQGPPHPSKTDILEAAYPDVAFCILYPVSLMPADKTKVAISGSWCLQAWQIQHQQAILLELNVTA